MKRINNWPTVVVAGLIIFGIVALGIVGMMHGGDQFWQLVMGLLALFGVGGTTAGAWMRPLRENVAHNDNPEVGGDYSPTGESDARSSER